MQPCKVSFNQYDFNEEDENELKITFKSVILIAGKQWSGWYFSNVHSVYTLKIL